MGRSNRVGAGQTIKLGNVDCGRLLSGQYCEVIEEHCGKDDRIRVRLPQNGAPQKPVAHFMRTDAGCVLDGDDRFNEVETGQHFIRLKGYVPADYRRITAIIYGGRASTLLVLV